jgi:hypothetical protein
LPNVYLTLEWLCEITCIKSADTDKTEEVVEESQMGINKNQKKLVAVNGKEKKDRVTRNMKQRKYELINK